MDQVVGPLAVLLLAASLAVQVVIAVEAGRSRRRLDRLCKREGVPVHSHRLPPLQGAMGSPAGYAIYAYRRGRWELESDLSGPGFEPTAPSMAGSYEGQMIKKESVPER